MRNLGIISHTPHYKAENDEIRGFVSTINEINHLTIIFKSFKLQIVSCFFTRGFSFQKICGLELLIRSSR